MTLFFTSFKVQIDVNNPVYKIKFLKNSRSLNHHPSRLHPLNIITVCILSSNTAFYIHGVDNKQNGDRNQQEIHLLLQPGMGYKNLVDWSPRRAELGRCHVIRFQTHRHKTRPKWTILAYWKVAKIYRLLTVGWDNDPFSVIN